MRSNTFSEYVLAKETISEDIKCYRSTKVQRFCEQLKTAQLKVHSPYCHQNDEREERAIDSITEPDIKRAQVTLTSLKP